MIYCVRVAIQKDEGATLGPTIKKHIIQVSTHQMSILMLFNKRTTLLFQVSARENPLDSYTRMTSYCNSDLQSPWSFVPRDI